MHDYTFCCCIIILLIILIFPDVVLKQMPMIRNLFNDIINYSLLIVLIICIILIDLPCGIICALSVLYLSMYINTTKPTIVLNKGSKLNYNNENRNNSNSINNNTVNNNKRKVHFNEEYNSINVPQDNTILSDSEFNYDNTKPFPNNNIKPFQYTNENSKATIVTNNNVNGVQNIIDNDNENDFITQVGEPDRSGFDISGCRYDMKNSPQNLTKNGPPLSQCSAYDPNQIKTCGTIFYPLNA